MRLADRYRLERRVGEGGGGGVFLVRDRLADDATMVLKRLHAPGHGLGQAGVAQWLVNEFQVLAQLDLPAVARVFDFGLAEPDAEEPGGPFFTREFIDGVPLDRALGPAESVAPDALVEAFASAAETLHALHRLGVVHGDLKPANLIVPLGTTRPVLIDFGLAHGALGAAERVRGGTLAFMPPERRERLLLGESLPPDPRADLFALAASMLAVLGLESADAPEPAWLQARAELRGLLAVARRGADADPDQRFATADDFLAALTNGARRVSASVSRVVLRPEGREAELGALLEHVGRRLLRREGGVSSVLLAGDEGSGRSTLLRELTWRAQLRGVQVLSVQGEGGDAPARRLREGAEVLAGESVADAEPDALVRAFVRAARHAPVLVLADDLDRADPAIAAQLRSLAYACEAGEPLLVIAAAADERAVSGFAPGARVSLGPLDEAAVSALCEQILGPIEPGVVSAVHARTAGTPLAVGEMLRALAGAGAVTAADVERVQVSARARDVAQRRIDALAPEVRTVAATVLALGESSEPTLVSALVGAQGAVEAARSAGIVTLRADGRLALVQAAVGEIATESLAPPARSDLYARVAEALANTEAPASARARAWVLAGNASRARSEATKAVQDLRGAGLPLAAAQLLESIRALDPDGADARALFAEAELYSEAGDSDAAARLASRAAETTESAIAQRARLLAGTSLQQRGEMARATEMLTAGLERAADGDERGEFLRELALIEFRAGHYADAVQRCASGLEHARAPRVRASLLARQGLAQSYLGDQTQAIERLEQSLALYAEIAAPRDEARVLAYLAIARYRSGDPAAARELYERVLDRARAAGDVSAMASARLNLGGLLDRAGDLPAALEHFAAAVKLAQRAGEPDTQLAARLNTAGDLVRLGSHARARAELDAVIASARPLGYREIVAHATLMLGVVHARTGEADAGLGLIAEAGEMFAAMGLAESVAEADFDAATVLLDRNSIGDVGRASERVAHARAALPQLGALEARACTLEGRVSLGRGDARAAQRSLTEAVAAAERSGEWESLAQALSARAHAHQAVGAEIHARRDRERALEVLETTAGILPPDLRSAFWSVPERVALRGADGGASVSDAGSSMHGFSAMATSAPTVIAQDQRLVLLLELSRRVGEETTLERVLDQAVRSAVELTNAERGAVLLVGADGALAVRARSSHAAAGDGPDERFSRSIAETVLIDGEAVATHNARGDTRFADFHSVHELSIGAVAAVPIRARGRTLGVLYVENRLRRAMWSPADVALMKAFAEQAAIAVEHASMVERLEAQTRELEAAQHEIEALLAARTEELESTRRSLARAEEALAGRYTPQGLIANTEAMRKVFAIIDRVKDSDVPVVIEGESGTGKELVARAVHFSGARRKGPFVVVHCGAIPETLLESELFGHVKGAFTGADRDRKGLLASAAGGTLLLDEVSEMPLRMQVELLRVLQDRRVRPVGSEREETIDIRVLVATNRPLADLVSEGRFREDLYYRLSVVTVRIPPLRARIDDVPALATHFLARFSEEHGVPRKRLSRDAVAKLLRASWPGNVRQLRHVLESAAVLAESDTIDAAQLALDEGTGHRARSVPPPAEGVSAPPPAVSPLAQRKAAERQRILDALEQVNWNKVRAATVLGMPRRTLYRRLREYGLLE